MKNKLITLIILFSLALLAAACAPTVTEEPTIPRPRSSSRLDCPTRPRRTAWIRAAH